MLKRDCKLKVSWVNTAGQRMYVTTQSFVPYPEAATPTHHWRLSVLKGHFLYTMDLFKQIVTEGSR